MFVYNKITFISSHISFSFFYLQSLLSSFSYFLLFIHFSFSLPFIYNNLSILFSVISFVLYLFILSFFYFQFNSPPFFIYNHFSLSFFLPLYLFILMNDIEAYVILTDDYNRTTFWKCLID